MIFKKAIATAVQLFGLFILFCGATTCILGIAMHIDSSSAQSKSGIPIAFFSLSFIIPGLFLYMRSKKMKKNIELMQTIAGMVISYRRIKISDVAARLTMPEQLAAKLLAAAVEKGLVRGKIDRTTGEFFTEEAEHEVANIRFCPSCGAPLDKVYLMGETIQCRSCGSIAR
ncbi:MAG: PCI domain-containing protein [Spirochaetes bacterium]|nr:PCI domain-containing protein [Spirochaetota bacterium]